MKDADCIRFLQESLPRLDLRWSGFRKVRRQVCKRLQRRLAELTLSDLDAYRRYLTAHPAEWQLLDSFCRISISRFYRDRQIFEDLGAKVLPAINHLAAAGGAARVRIWSAGCASGEEPYTLALLWHFRLPDHARLPLEIIATDLDPLLLERARAACYDAASLKELPDQWLTEAFRCRDHHFCLQPTYRSGVQFLRQDIRKETPAGAFHLVACRNLAFTYFAEPLQHEVLARIATVLQPGGFLVLGIHEMLPAGQTAFTSFQDNRFLFRKINPTREKDISQDPAASTSTSHPADPPFPRR
jgi:chemotaxis protein methyltransferase CheR